MQAKVEALGSITIVYLLGQVDMETASMFRQKAMPHFSSKQIVFDFKNLSFVGSYGVLPFLQAVEELFMMNTQNLKFSGLNCDFKRIFASMKLGEVPSFDTPEKAAQAYQLRPASTIQTSNPATAPVGETGATR